MAETLGQAILELDVDEQPLDRGLRDAEQKVLKSVTVQQAMLDSLSSRLTARMAVMGPMMDRALSEPMQRFVASLADAESQAVRTMNAVQALANVANVYQGQEMANTPIGPMETRQAATLQRPLSEQFDIARYHREMQQLAMAPTAGMHIWRGEARKPEEVMNPGTVGMHWTARPEATIRPGASWDDHMAVVYHAVLDQVSHAISRQHPSWSISKSGDYEAEVRPLPGTQLTVLGAHVYDRNAGGRRGEQAFPSPFAGNLDDASGWTYHPIGKAVDISSQGGFMHGMYQERFGVEFREMSNRHFHDLLKHLAELWQESSDYVQGYKRRIFEEMARRASVPMGNETLYRGFSERQGLAKQHPRGMESWSDSRGVAEYFAGRGQTVGESMAGLKAPASRGGDMLSLPPGAVSRGFPLWMFTDMGSNTKEREWLVDASGFFQKVLARIESDRNDFRRRILVEYTQHTLRETASDAAIVKGWSYGPLQKRLDMGSASGDVLDAMEARRMADLNKQATIGDSLHKQARIGGFTPRQLESKRARMARWIQEGRLRIAGGSGPPRGRPFRGTKMVPSPWEEVDGEYVGQEGEPHGVPMSPEDFLFSGDNSEGEWGDYEGPEGDAMGSPGGGGGPAYDPRYGWYPGGDRHYRRGRRSRARSFWDQAWTGGGGGYGGGGGGRRGGGGGFYFSPGVGPFRYRRGGGGGDGGGPLKKALWGGGLFAGAGTLAGFGGLGIERMFMTAGSLAGSAGAGLAGGALALGGNLGRMAVGMGSDLAVTASTIKDTQALGQAYAKVQEAVTRYGAGSRAAIEAQKELNYQMTALGNTAGVKAELGLSKATIKLNEFWDKQTSGARVQASKVLMQFVDLGHTYVPLIAKAAETNLGIIDKNIHPLFRWLKGPEGTGIFLDLEKQFADKLPTSIHAFTMALEFVVKTIDSASHHTGGFIQGIDKFFTKWNQPQNFAVWDKEIGKLIGDFDMWWKFIKLIGQDLHLLFTNDAGLGKSLIETFTKMLEHAKAYMESTEGKGKLSNIFTAHKEEVLAIVKLLPLLMDPLAKIYLTIAPPLIRAFTKIFELIAKVLTGLQELSPAFSYIMGGALILGKIGLLNGALRGTAEAFGLIQKKAKAAGEMTVAEIEAERAALAYGGMSPIPGQLALPMGKQSPLSKLPTPLTDWKSRAVRGLAQAGLGALAGSTIAEVAGIHGTGATALTLGGAGAGLGQALAPLMGISGPWGMAAGAAIGVTAPYIGKLIGDAFGGHVNEHMGKRFAAGVVGLGAGVGMTAKQEDEYAKRLANDRKATAHERKRLEELQEVNPYTGLPQGTHREISSQFNRAFNAEYREGKQTAGVAIGHFAGVETKTVPAFISDVLPPLKQLSGEARKEAARAMLAYAAELEHKGELGKGAVHKIVHEMEGQFHGLVPSISKGAANAGDSIAKAMNLDHAKNNMANALKDMRAKMGLFSVDENVTGGTWVKNTGEAMKNLKSIILNTTGDTRKKAEDDLHKLQGKSHDVFSKMASDTDQNMKALQGSVKAGIKGARPHVEAEFDSFQKTIHEAMKAGVLSSKEGNKLIGEALNEEIKVLGGKPVHVTITPGMPSAEDLHKAGFAEGGMFQIGTPGDRGHDAIPMNIGGANVMVGSGEIATVFNRHQIPEVNAALEERGYAGGLHGLFGKVNTPHYMASGGFVRSEAFPGPRGRIDQGVDWAGPGPVRAVLPGTVMSTGLWPGWPGSGGIVYQTSKGPVYVMEAFRPAAGLHKGSHIGEGQIIGYDLGGSTGIEAGWANASGTAPIVRYGNNPDGTPMSGGINFARFIGGGPGGGTGPGVQWHDLHMPHVHGTGAVAGVVRASLTRMLGAANAYGRRQAGGGGGGKSSAGGKYNRGQLERLWIQYGGNPASAHLAAAIALAESGGNPNSENHNSDGSIDRGLWQINSVHGRQSTFDIAGNVRAAIAISSNGHNWTPWVTYNKGAYRQFMATGGFVGLATGSKNVAQTAAVKHGTSKPKGSKRKPKTKAPTHISYRSLIGSLENIPGMEGIEKVLGPAEEQYGVYGKEAELIEGMTGNTASILPADMSYLEPTLQPGQTINPYDLASKAEISNQNFIQKTAGGTGNDQLTLQGSLLGWIGGLLDHKLISKDQAAILGGVHSSRAGKAINPVKFGWPVGVYAAQQHVLNKELAQSQAVVEILRKQKDKAITARRRAEKRMRRLIELAKAAKKRLDAMKARMERIKTAGLRKKLTAAMHNEFIREEKEAASIHLGEVSEVLGSEKQLPSKEQHPGVIKALTDEQNAIHRYDKGLQQSIVHTSVSTASQALLLNEVKKEMTPIENQLQQLGGSKTSVGKGGAIGQIDKQITGLGRGIEGLDGKIKDQVLTTQPQLRLSLNSIASSLAESAEKLAPILTTTGGSTDATKEQLAALQKEANERLWKENVVLKQQYEVLSKLPAFGGHFATGGIVPGGLGEPRTIIAHGGETITPAGKQPIVHVIVQDGAVDTDKIKVQAEGAAARVLRSTGVNLTASLPSAGGMLG